MCRPERLPLRTLPRASIRGSFLLASEDKAQQKDNGHGYGGYEITVHFVLFFEIGRAHV